MSKNNFWRRVANLIGAIAYLMIAIQWLWLLATALIPILTSDTYQELFMPQQSAVVTESAVTEISLPPAVQAIIVAVSVAFAIGISLYAIYMVPRAVSRVSHKSIEKVATATVVRTTRHQTIKPKQRQVLITRYIWLIKYLAIALPIVLAWLPIYHRVGIEHQIIIIVAGFLASLSLVGLGLQLLVSYLAKVPIKNLW